MCASSTPRLVGVHVRVMELSVVVPQSSPVCQHMRLEKSLVWMPFSAMRSLIPRLLLPTWPYQRSRILHCSLC